jgi:3-oxoacyl-[acyl-carrier protein] reductase
MAIETVESSFKMQDRTAILTGPCNTFNQAIAMKLTQLGTNVAFIDKNVDKAQRFAQQLMDTREINERFGRAHAIAADLTTANGVKDAITRAAEAFGGVDFYIDGSMITEGRRFREQQSLDNLNSFIDTNLRAPIMCTHAVLKFLEGRKRGRVIYLMHDAASTGRTNNSLGAATRAGLSDFARSLAREVTEFNVTVNCVSIGVTEEFVLAQNFAPATEGSTISVQEALSRLNQTLPQTLLMEPERIANVVAFLASPMGAGITGQTITANRSGRGVPGSFS